MGSAESKQAAARLPQACLSNTKFPARFDIYYKNKCSLKLVLGEDKSQPSKLMTLPNGWHGELILYNGLTTDAEPLAVARAGRSMGYHDKIELAAPQPGQQPIREELRSQCNVWSMAYAFAIAVGPGSLPEKFEWRSSRSDAVKELDEAGSGWKLVRLGNRDEIVAVASEARLSRSWSKFAAFQFVGRGASGQLGEAWAVMAVVSFARIAQKQVQAAMGASAA